MLKKVDRDSNGHFALKVIGKDLITHDTYNFELEFPDPDWIFGLPAGMHIMFHATVNGCSLSRKYTPVSLVNKKGSANFPIKIYRKHPDWPGKGLFTQHLEDNVKVGDYIMC